MYYKARGVDDDLIAECKEVKSISEQTTFDENTLNVKSICDTFNDLSNDVFRHFEERVSSLNLIKLALPFLDKRSNPRKLICLIGVRGGEN